MVQARVPKPPSARNAAQATEASTDMDETPFVASRSTSQAMYSRYPLITANREARFLSSLGRGLLKSSFKLFAMEF